LHNLLKSYHKANRKNKNRLSHYTQIYVLISIFIIASLYHPVSLQCLNDRYLKYSVVHTIPCDTIIIKPPNINPALIAYHYIHDGKWEETISFIDSILFGNSSSLMQVNNIAYLYNYLGTAHKRAGSYFLSEVSYQIARTLAVIKKDKTLADYIELNKADLQLEKRNFLESIKTNHNLQQKKNLKRDIIAISLLDMATASLGAANLPLANLAISKLLDLLETESFEEEFKMALFYLNYGRYLTSMKKYDEGIKLLKSALFECQQSYPENHYINAVIFRHLGISYISINEPDSAHYYLGKAIGLLENNDIESSKQNGADYETVLVESLLSRGGLFLQQYSKSRNEKSDLLTKAYSDYHTSVNRIARLSHIRQSESSRFIIAEKGTEAFKLGIFTSLNLFENTREQKYLDQAFTWSIIAKSLSLHWLSQRDYIYPIAGIPLDSLSKLQEMREDIQDWLDRIDVIENEMAIPDTADLDQICQVVLRYELLEQQIKENYKSIKAASNNNEISDNLIPDNFRHETYLGYQDLDSLLIIFGVNHKQRFHKIIPLDSTIRNDIDRYKRLISRPRLGVYGQKEILDFQYISNRIYSAIIEPVEEFIESKNLAIHLDGCLLGLPFESLVFNHTEPTQIRKFKYLDYLIHKYHVRYVASPFLLQEEGNPNSIKKSLLLVCPDQMNELSMASESDRINAILPKLKIQSLDDISSNFKTEMSNYQNIHISSHLLSRDDDFMESGLVCGNGEGSTILPFKEILYSKLNNAHIYLNGCESGSGPINHGEGLMSLSLAYTMAGAGSIIQHLWKAPDQAAADIAVQYYKNSKWVKPEKALQKAKKNYLKEAKPGHDHPFYWAGIVYYGHRNDHNKKPYLVLGAVIVLTFGMVYLRWRKVRLK